MMNRFWSSKVALLAGAVLLFGSGWLMGQQSATTQKTLMHVFAYTPIEGATPQDFENFRMATASLVGKVPGLKRVWVGKLRMPLEVDDKKRVYGAAMEFEDAKALAAYASNPAHDAWMKVYEKVREAGTTTFDIPGE